MIDIKKIDGDGIKKYKENLSNRNMDPSDVDHLLDLNIKRKDEKSPIPKETKSSL